MSATQKKQNPGHSRSNSEDGSIHNNILRIQTKSDVFKKYEIVQVLGTGSMGAVSKARIKDGKVGGSAFDAKPKTIVDKIKKKVNKVTRLDNGNKQARPKQSQDYYYALKSIQLDRVSPMFIEELQNEIDILRSMDHPNIVKAHEVYMVKKKQIYLVLELCDGGDLYTRSPYSEFEAARIVTKLTSAIRYMHERGIVHRDLKFENIMFENTTKAAEVKVIDFGLSKKFLGTPGTMTERVGTIYTMAPQVLQGIYSSQADLWALGVIAYMLLSSSKPFYAKRRRQMIDRIMRARPSFDSPVWQGISDEAKDFVRKLLVVDPKVRMNAAQAMNHTWIVHREQLPDDIPSQEVLDALDDCLVQYRQTSQLKKLALNVIAHRSTTKEIIQLRKVFDALDTEKNGKLDFDEFKSALEKMDYSEEDIDEIFSSIDLNQNGYIMYTEFLAATIEMHGRVEEDRISEAFDRIDSDDTGFISKENLREALGQDCSPDEVDAIVKACDRNNDGKISYQEFLLHFREQTQEQVNTIAEDEQEQSVSESGTSLFGIDVKIPGGRFDSDLDPSLQKQIVETS